MTKSNQGVAALAAIAVNIVGAIGFFVERLSQPESKRDLANLTMRMSMRRFIRLTNGFSKKIDKHVAMISLYFMYYNFAACIRRSALHQR